MATTETGSLLNRERLQMEMHKAGVDAVILAAPENSFYLSGVFIRTQVTIRDRLAIVVWPRESEPVFIVCNIEESLARSQSAIPDVRTYVEFACSPMDVVADVLRERRLTRSMLGIEQRFLTVAYEEQLRERAPDARFRAFDDAMERVRAIKMQGEINRAEEAFKRTEETIAEAWGASRAGDTEKQIADRMTNGVAARGADNVRHLTLSSGENILDPHRPPTNRVLRRGDLLLTDFGANWGGFCSDIARMGVIGEPDEIVRAEYQTFHDIYSRTIERCRPGVTAGEIFRACYDGFAAKGLQLRSPQIGHSLGRGGGHEEPILHPRNTEVIEEGMLLCIEPSLVTAPTRRYHVEDLVLITGEGYRILSNYDTTKQLFIVPT